MGLESVINVNISRQTAGVERAGFGVPCIFGPTSAGGAAVATFTSVLAMLDVYASSDPEVLMATKIFSQTPHPRKIKVRKTSAAVAQVVTFTPNVTTQSVAHYKVKLNGTTYDFTSDTDPTAAEIVTGLTALINADSAAVVTASGSSTLIITADTAGVAFTYEALTANMGTPVLTTASNGIADDILAAAQEDSEWYCAMLTSTTVAVQREAARAIESIGKMLAVRDAESATRTSATTDLAYLLKASAYYRTHVWYTGTSGDYLEAAISGLMLPTDPGSENWSYKSPAGVTVDNWTDTEKGYLDGKNANYFVTLGGVKVTMKKGMTAGGEYIDIIRGVDWMKARMAERIFGKLVNLPKIPFTDAGIELVATEVRAQLSEGVRVGFIQAGFVVTVPKASEISDNDKAARLLTGIGFTAKVVGAVNEMEINGVITL